MNTIEEKEIKDHYKSDSKWIYVLLAVLLFLTAVAFHRDATPQWEQYQAQFRQILTQKFGKKASDNFSYGMKQIWIKDVNRIDRCTTCHLGIDIPKLSGEDIPLVFRTHPDKALIDEHPFDKFGCTYCHGGKGYALTVEEAHFSNPVGWEDMFLSARLANRYGFPDYKNLPLVEMNCNACHLHEKEVAGLTYINKAKELFTEKMCTCCHTFSEYKADVGPDLTYEGDKPNDLYDFSNITNWGSLPPSVFSWHFLHFKAPYLVSPLSLMSNFNFKDQEIRSLIMLVLSFKNMPERFVAKPDPKNVFKPECVSGVPAAPGAFTGATGAGVEPVVKNTKM
jgi:hypothetical protein